MKTYLTSILYGTLLSAALTLSSCVDMVDNVKDVSVAEILDVSYKVNGVTGFVPASGEFEPDPDFPTNGLDVVFTNVYTDNIVYGETDADGVVSAALEPGVYSIQVSGVTENAGQEYYLTGTVTSAPVYEDISKEESKSNKDYWVNIRPSKVGSLVFSEIYYCGIAPYYFRDQTYQICNNGDEVVYLDGVCFAQLFPEFATSIKPSWPEEEGLDNYTYATWVWQFPGSGSEYPLNPGESVVVVQEARNHLESNALSIDNSMAEWECNTDGGERGRDNAKVPNMPYIFYTSFNSLQWLTSVFGSAFALYKPDGDIITDEYYSKNGPNVCSEINESAKYARIEANSIIDGVECLPNMNSMQMKRIPGFVDAGATSVNDRYVGKSICRKVLSYRADGTPVYQDTNNSTNDFEVMERPAIRRYGEKVPSWSPSRQ